MSSRATRATRHASRARVELRLDIIAGPCAGKVFKGTKARMTVGRKGACDVSAKGDDGVSERHGEIRYDDAREVWVIYDVGSSNGTDVDGVALEDGGEGVDLVDGSVIKLGRDTTVVARVGAGAREAHVEETTTTTTTTTKDKTTAPIVDAEVPPKSAVKAGGRRGGGASASERGKRASVAPTKPAARKRARPDTTKDKTTDDDGGDANATTTSSAVTNDENVAPLDSAAAAASDDADGAAPRASKSQPPTTRPCPTVETYCRDARDAALADIRTDASRAVHDLRARARVLIDSLLP
jgi:predicted component of type VI protein secretion system